jgi:hypothetical protein
MRVGIAKADLIEEACMAVQGDVNEGARDEANRDGDREALVTEPG